MSENAALLTRLLDEAAIRDATARFADTCIHADYDGFRVLWADDAEWVIGGTEGQPFERRAQGVDDIVAMLRNLREERERERESTSFSLRCRALSRSMVTRRQPAVYATRPRAVLERATTETTGYGLIAYGVRTMAGCLRAAPISTCGSTSPHFLETFSPPRPDSPR
jgi:hypothetical protein